MVEIGGGEPAAGDDDEGLQDIVLHVVVVIDDLGDSLLQLGRVFDVFVDAVVM